MPKRLLLTRGIELLTLAMLAAIPLMVSNVYILGLLTLLAIYAILLIGLDVSVGYLGQVNLGHAAFLALGAYASGLCVTLLGFGMPAALGVSLLIGLMIGAVLAIPALRLEGSQQRPLRHVGSSVAKAELRRASAPEVSLNPRVTQSTACVAPLSSVVEHLATVLCW